MKISILFLAFIIICFVAQSQSGATGNQIAQNNPIPQAQKLPPSPTLRAVHQLEALQERIDLTQDQAIILNSILLDENVALDSLSLHPTGDQKVDGQIRRDIYHNADVRIYSYLTDAQQLQYVLWKQEQRIKNMEKRQQTNQAMIDSLTRQQPQSH
jgi:hypothetical protein